MLVEEFELGVLWDEYGLVGDIVVSFFFTVPCLSSGIVTGNPRVFSRNLYPCKRVRVRVSRGFVDIPVPPHRSVRHAFDLPRLYQLCGLWLHLRLSLASIISSTPAPKHLACPQSTHLPIWASLLNLPLLWVSTPTAAPTRLVLLVIPSPLSWCLPCCLDVLEHR